MEIEPHCDCAVSQRKPRPRCKTARFTSLQRSRGRRRGRLAKPTYRASAPPNIVEPSCANTATGLGRPQVFPRDGLEHRGRAGLWRSSSSFIRSQPPPAEPNAPVSGAHQRNIPPITNATVGVQTDPAIFASASSPEELTSATATFFPWKAENGKQK
jgi:hypothetical protein